ncbi:hypothetical protein T484DRAFT_1956990 [Baffinella frigidus]|nr:hypothetical protein T484DRAFT_1956990 [Cryptophyta sp. CCMP2293]|eukprot:CAMPEP_0180173386 /NCGR_PEP_ID=MMETSP0986-20121125/35549_1 /TAXON_ID=697907 /ORGANISM="non described non described, Strain CCMP2293" /LENGTH=65 /DNA_ID=CAMNT_0022125573 /DNA_START=110 /DNA_END=307 /DNA_ORIENTATION=-
MRPLRDEKDGPTSGWSLGRARLGMQARTGPPQDVVWDGPAWGGMYPRTGPPQGQRGRARLGGDVV